MIYYKGGNFLSQYVYGCNRVDTRQQYFIHHSDLLERYNFEESLKDSRGRNRKGGRPRVKITDITKAINLYNTGEYSVKEIIETICISRTTFYRYLNCNKK